MSLMWMGCIALAWAIDPALNGSGGPESDETADRISEEEPDGPDRSGPPPVIAPEVLELPEPERHVLRDGVEVLHVRVPGVRKLEITVMPRQGGGELELGRHVEAALGWLIDVGTEAHEPAELEALEDLHDVNAWSSLRTHYGVLGVDAPREEIDLAMELLSDMIRGPTFPKADVQRYTKDKLLWYRARGPSRPRSVADALLAYSWFPADHPYGERPDMAQLEVLNRKALAEAYRDWVASAPVTVLSVGDFDYDEVAPRLAVAVSGVGAPGEVATEVDCPPPSVSRVLASALPGQEQVTLRMRTSAPHRGHDDAIAAWAGAYVFGGHFLSRLNATLREDKGWTYGARASYDRTLHQGMLTVSVDVDASNVAGAVREIERELQRVVDEGVTPEELGLAQRRLVADWNETLVTADDAHGRYLAQLVDGTSMAERRADYLALDDVVPSDVQRVAKEHWGPDSVRVWTLVGEQQAVQEQLDALGWAVEWVDPTDAILGKVPAATP